VRMPSLGGVCGAAGRGSEHVESVGGPNRFADVDQGGVALVAAAPCVDAYGMHLRSSPLIHRPVALSPPTPCTRLLLVPADDHRHGSRRQWHLMGPHIPVLSC
jgi:hypothetical protein